MEHSVADLDIFEADDARKVALEPDALAIKVIENHGTYPPRSPSVVSARDCRQGDDTVLASLWRSRRGAQFQAISRHLVDGSAPRTPITRGGVDPGRLRCLPRIYHFTDVANLPAILAAGELRCHRMAANAVDVGDPSIKSRRALIDVKCGPGGKVCDYVPFYYAPRSPMLYSIMCGNVPDVLRISDG